MPRPSKSIKLVSKHVTKEEIEGREAVEETLRGSDDKLVPPKYLSYSQKQIFKNIVNELKNSGILGNLDVYLLETCAIAIDRLQDIEQLINNDINNLVNKSLLSAKDKYSKDFFKCCTELSLSPQSRAKIGNINILQQETDNDPLLKLLNGEN